MGTLDTASGNADNGRIVYADPERGHCQLCHDHAGLPLPFAGNIGPDLSRVSERLSSAELRVRISDPTRVNPDTAMPAYHRTLGLHQVQGRFRGKPILTKQELADVVAFLSEGGSK